MTRRRNGGKTEPENVDDAEKDVYDELNADRKPSISNALPRPSLVGSDVKPVVVQET